MKIKSEIPFYVGLFLDEYVTAIAEIKTPRQMAVKKIKNSFANNFVFEHHYLHRKIYIARNISYGLFCGEWCVGVCMFGFPVWVEYPSLCPPLTSSECPELIRLATMRGLPKNSESWFIGKCIKLMLCDWVAETGITPKCITSFCDHAMGFDGALYKSTNFSFFRKTKGRASNPGGAHGKWGSNEHKQDSIKSFYVYFYDRKKRVHNNGKNKTDTGV